MTDENNNTVTASGSSAEAGSDCHKIGVKLVTKLEAGKVYKDMEDNEIFVCLSDADGHGDCMTLTLPRSFGYSHFESDTYEEIAESLVDYFIQQNTEH